MSIFPAKKKGKNFFCLFFETKEKGGRPKVESDTIGSSTRVKQSRLNKPASKKKKASSVTPTNRPGKREKRDLKFSRACGEVEERETRRRSGRRKTKGDKMAAVAPSSEANAFVDGKENEEQSGQVEAKQQQKSLAEMFVEGGDIETARNENLFQDLQKRSLTEKEEEIVKARTTHMQKMFEEFEKREKKRKVEELLGVCPDLTEKEVVYALEMYDGNEEDTAMALTDPNIKRRVKNLANGTFTEQRRISRSRSSGPKKKYVAPAPAPGGVFCGSFRGKINYAATNKSAAVQSSAAADADATTTPRRSPRKAPEEVQEAGKDASAVAKSPAEEKPAEQTTSPCENAKIDDIMTEKTGGEKKKVTKAKRKNAPGSKDAAAKDAAKSPKRTTPRKTTTPRKSVEEVAVIPKGARTPRKSPRKTPRKAKEVKCVSEVKAAKETNSGTISAVSADTKSASEALNSAEPGSVKSKTKRARNGGRSSGGKKLQFTSSSSTPGDGLAKAADAAKPKGPVAVAEASPAPPKPRRAAALKTKAGGPRKKPRLGRVRQKSTKRGEVIEIGEVRFEKGWHNQGYIFPDGFYAQTPFRSSVELDKIVIHECRIFGRGGQYWPAPTFQIVTQDRPDEKLDAKSPTGCWNAVLKRINGEISRRIDEGEDLPPPPKTAIAGPEYFGLNQPDVISAIEKKDPDRRCELYWAGKMDREEYIETGIVQQPRVNRVSKGSSSRSKKSGSKRRRHSEYSESELSDDDYGNEEGYGKNRWNSVNRSERYKARCKDRGDQNVDENAQADNPLPDFIDPITLEPVDNPAISPYGHVMGMATWRAVLDEQGKCPFTKQELSIMNIKKLTKTNIDQYRHKIVDLAH